MFSHNLPTSLARSIPWLVGINLNDLTVFQSLFVNRVDGWMGPWYFCPLFKIWALSISGRTNDSMYIYIYIYNYTYEYGLLFVMKEDNSA